MKKNEALKLAIDGKRVMPSSSPLGEYVYWNGGSFMYQSSIPYILPTIATGILNGDKEWIVYEPARSFIVGQYAYFGGIEVIITGYDPIKNLYSFVRDPRFTPNQGCPCCSCQAKPTFTGECEASSLEMRRG